MDLDQIASLCFRCRSLNHLEANLEWLLVHLEHRAVGLVLHFGFQYLFHPLYHPKSHLKEYLALNLIQ